MCHVHYEGRTFISYENAMVTHVMATIKEDLQYLELCTPALAITKGILITMSTGGLMGQRVIQKSQFLSCCQNWNRGEIFQ